MTECMDSHLVVLVSGTEMHSVTATDVGGNEVCMASVGTLQLLGLCFYYARVYC